MVRPLPRKAQGERLIWIEKLWLGHARSNEIDATYVALGKDWRALAVEPHLAAWRVSIGRPALDK
jgi:hypothetical protein